MLLTSCCSNNGKKMHQTLIQTSEIALHVLELVKLFIRGFSDGLATRPPVIQLNRVAIRNTISPGMVQCCTEGATLLVCISISPALHHLAVIFSCVKSTGNSRHSFDFFPPTSRNSCSGSTQKGHFKGTTRDSWKVCF